MYCLEVNNGWQDSRGHPQDPAARGIITLPKKDRTAIATHASEHQYLGLRLDSVAAYFTLSAVMPSTMWRLKTT